MAAVWALAAALAAAAAVAAWRGAGGGGGAAAVFAVGDLAPADGTLLLSVLGEVFDVSAGRRFYAPPSHYAFFAGRDGSRVFVTGEFDGGPAGGVPAHRVADLADAQLLQIDEWRAQ
jgi:hypothetical protein